MKKKFLLSLMIIAMLVCVFAISVSASDRTSISYTDINGTVHNVPVVKYESATVETVANAIKTGDTRGHNCVVSATTRIMDNGSYAIVMDSNGELTAYPSWYIIDATGDENYAEVYEIGYGYLNSVSGKTYKDGAIRYIEFPEGITAIRKNSVFGGDSTAAKYESNVTEMRIPSTVTVIRAGSLVSAPSLKKIYIAENSQMTSIPDEALSECPYLEYFQFENLSLLTDIDGFRQCEKLSCDVDLSNCTSLKTIGSKAFYKTDIRKITLPDSVEKIDNDAFAYCYNSYLASSYLPSSLKTIGTMFFSYNNNLLDTYVFPEGVKSIGNEPFQDSKVAGGPSGKELNLVFLGKVTGVVYLNGNGHQKHADKVTVYFAQNSLSEYNQNGFKIKPSGSSYTDVERAIRAVFCNDDNAVTLAYITNTDGTSWQEGTFEMENHDHFGALTVVDETCGADGSETIACIVCDKSIVTTLEATGNHSYSDGVCTVCGHSLCPGGIDHNLKLDAVYANGFLNNGIIVNKCQNDGCTHEIELSDAEAIFTFKGYSAKINGDKITVGYTVNQNALSVYEKATGKTLNYGVVASIASGVENSPIAISDNKLVSDQNVIMVNVDKTYTAFDFILTGFTSEHYDAALVMCAYVFDGEKLAYICSNNGVDGQYDYAYSVTFGSQATN